MSSKRAKAKTTKKRPQRATSNVFAMFDQSQIQEFKEAFNMIDQNRDGFIDKEDLHDMLASLGENPLPSCPCGSLCPQHRPGNGESCRVTSCPHPALDTGCAGMPQSLAGISLLHQLATEGVLVRHPRAAALCAAQRCTHQKGRDPRSWGSSAMGATTSCSHGVFEKSHPRMSLGLSSVEQSPSIALTWGDKGWSPCWFE